MSGPAMVPAGPYGTPAVPPAPAELLRRRRSPLAWVTMVVGGGGGARGARGRGGGAPAPLPPLPSVIAIVGVTPAA